jgi:hypothetical protein
MLYVVGDEENPSVIGAIKMGLSRMLSFAWIAILMNLVIAGGTMLLFIPGLILSFALTLSSYVFVAEGKKGMEVLLRSSSLTKGFRGAIAWRYAIAGFSIIIPMALVLAIGLPLLIGSSETSKLVENIISSVISIFLTPIFIIFGYLIFKELSQCRPAEQFSPSNKGKKLYVFLAVLGVIMFVAMIVGSCIATLKTKSMLINSEILNGNNIQITQPSESHKRDTQRVTDISTASIMLGSYFSVNGNYPVSLTISKTTDNDFVLRTNEVVPLTEFNDPLTKDGWYYGYVSDGKTYTLTARLENEEDKTSYYCDKQEKETSGLCIYKYTQPSTVKTY